MASQTAQGWKVTDPRRLIGQPIPTNEYVKKTQVEWKKKKDIFSPQHVTSLQSLA